MARKAGRRAASGHLAGSSRLRTNGPQPNRLKPMAIPATMMTATADQCGARLKVISIRGTKMRNVMGAADCENTATVTPARAASSAAVRQADASWPSEKR